MSHIKKLAFIPALIGATVLTNGCGGDSHSYSVIPVISGTVVKGVLRNADCIATDTAGNELYSSVGETSACTNSRGRYSFQLLSNPTTPVVVTIQARTGTQMLCDYPSGCGNGVDFNNPLDLASDFSLRAVVPSISTTARTQQVNVSPWTEIATARAVSTATTLSSLTTTQVQSAYTEVASVLNNVLSLEGNANDAFDGNFFSIDLVDLANPDQDTDIDSGEERKATLLSLASASLFNLVDTAGTTNTNITSVVQNLATSFQSDGKFNVNDTAANIDLTDTVNLASIVSGISNVAQNIQSRLSTTATTSLQSLLNVDDLSTELANIENEAINLAAEKEAVVDADNDPTEPQPIDTDGDDDDDDDDGSGSSGSGGTGGP